MLEVLVGATFADCDEDNRLLGPTAAESADESKDTVAESIETEAKCFVDMTFTKSTETDESIENKGFVNTTVSESAGAHRKDVEEQSLLVLLPSSPSPSSSSSDKDEWNDCGEPFPEWLNFVDGV